MHKKFISVTMLPLVLALIICFCIPADSVCAQTGTAVTIKVGNKSFKGVFYNNAAAKGMLESMSNKFKMSDLNGNEKYKYLDRDFPTDEKKVKRIKAGDIMLYGSDCLVIFYKSFDTSYEYTRVGRITNPEGLKKAVGKKSVTVTFSKDKDIRLSEKNLTLNPGNKKTIKLKGATAKKVKWRTSNKNVATVSKGTITAKKPGKVTITAKYNKKKYKCNVIVVQSEEPDPNPQKNEEEFNSNTTKSDVERTLSMKIDDKKVSVEWESNDSVAALRELVKEKPLTLQMSMYGGFEQVGSIGTGLPRNDVQTTTGAGDIILYSGTQIVVFYGSNSWAYTRLGHITDQDSAGMAELLGNGDVTITISME